KIKIAIEEHMNFMLETYHKGAWRYWKENYKNKKSPHFQDILEKAKKLSETGIPTLESVKAVTKEIEDEYAKVRSDNEINKAIEDHMNFMLETYFRKASDKYKKHYKATELSRLIEEAKELSETGIPTLESLKAVIKEIQDKSVGVRIKGEGKRLREGSYSWVGYIVAWVILTPLLAFVINLAFWGVMTGGNANYWIFLITQGSWTFLVGGIGAVIILFLWYVEYS
ncbi:MAG: hypothetical protein ACFE8V_02690, partial [Promethearchaeota archaeon]